MERENINLVSFLIFSLFYKGGNMQLNGINKSYFSKNNTLHILKDVSATFNSGNFYAIMGRSGSGKSTLVNILGMLDSYDSGEYFFDGKDVKKFTENEKSDIRALKIGFVFQSFYLNSNLTALENVLLPTYINKSISKNNRKKIGIELLEKFGLGDRINHKPSELSGGEQQRVAIARALINNPSIIIADEPTGNLDSKSEKDIFQLLRNIADGGKTVIVVSHNDLIKSYCDVLYVMNDGRMLEVINEQS